MMLRTLDRVIHWGDRTFVVISVCMLAVMIVTVSAGIVSRYVLGEPFDWTEELATFLFICISFLGAAVASARRKHVVVDFLTGRFSRNALNAIRAGTWIFSIIFLVMVALGAIILQPQMLTHTSVALGIPKNLYYVPVFISSVYMVIVCVTDLIVAINEMVG